MKPQSVRELKAELSAEVILQAGDTPEAMSFFASTEPPMPKGVGLGISLRSDGEHVLAIRSASVESAQKIADRAAGEAEIKIISVSKRTTPGYLQGVHRPLEAGLQVGMADKNFVGTLGCFVVDANGKIFALSNSHVLADEGTAFPGHKIGQPFGSPVSMIGVLERFIPFSRTAPNLVDCAIARIDPGVKVLERWNGAIAGQITGTHRLVSEDLGIEVLKVGRTTGARRGKITAVEMDGLPVAYDLGVIHFNDQVEISGGAATDFSAPGDSGSLILMPDGKAIALLFAGGKDDQGVDYTYGNKIENVLSALGVSFP